MTRRPDRCLTALVPALAGLGAAAPAWAQALAQGRGVEVPWWRVAGALAFCIGLAVAAAFFLKKRLGGGPALFSSAQRKVKLVETLRLSHQIDLCVIHYGGKELLVAAGANGASLLSTADIAEDAA